MDQRETLQILACCTVVLYFKFLFSTLFLGQSRVRAPEDADVNKSIGQPAQPTITQDENGFTSEERATRIVANDMENIFIGLILYWAAYVAGGSYTITSVTVIIFTVCRILHTIFYMYSVQPWRTIIWSVAALCNMVIAINVLIGAFDEDLKVNN